MSPLCFVTPKWHILAWFRVFWVITRHNRSKNLTYVLFPEKKVYVRTYVYALDRYYKRWRRDLFTYWHTWLRHSDVTCGVVSSFGLILLQKYKICIISTTSVSFFSNTVFTLSEFRFLTDLIFYRYQQMFHYTELGTIAVISLSFHLKPTQMHSRQNIVSYLRNTPIQSWTAVEPIHGWGLG